MDSFNKNLKFFQNSGVCPIDSVIRCATSCKATNIKILKSSNSCVSFERKQNTIFSPLFTEYEVYLLFRVLSLILLGLYLYFNLVILSLFSFVLFSSKWFIKDNILLFNFAYVSDASCLLLTFWTK